MCFIIRKGSEQFIIAKKDIVCYKVMFPISEKEVRSPYMLSVYTLGQRYSRPFAIKLSRPRRANDEISIGYHSYSTIDRALLETYYSNGTYCITKCIIPKGSTYFVDPYNKEYVSNSITIKENITK